MRSTPDVLRRLSALGLLAGVLTGAASYTAVMAAGASAREAAWSAHVATTTAEAEVAIAQSRAAAATAVLTNASGSTNATTAIDPLVTAADRLAIAAGASQDDASFAPISAAAKALPPYSSAIGSALGSTTTAGGSGSSAATTATRLRTADEAVASATAPLQGLVSEQLADVADAQTFASLAAALPIVVGGAATLLLTGTMVWLARKTHRVVNPPLLVGTLLVAGTTLFSAAAAVQSSGIVADAATGADALKGQGVLLAAAHEARAAELQAALGALGGSTAQVQTAGQEAQNATGRVDALTVGNDSVGNTGRKAWAAYVATQKQTIAAAPGDRAKAATNATTTSATAFAAFLKEIPAVTATTQNDTTAPAAGSILPWLALLAGLGGGSMAWIGLDRRLKDYR